MKTGFRPFASLVRTARFERASLALLMLGSHNGRRYGDLLYDLEREEKHES